MRVKTLRITALALAALATVGGVAAAPAFAAVRLVDLQVKVQDRPGGRAPEMYTLSPAQSVPLAVGETIRVSLVGITAGGAQVPVNARFSEAAGKASIELGKSGGNWVIVRGTGSGGNGLAQIAYQVVGNAYTMKGGFASGRITFQMIAQAALSRHDNRPGDARQQQAEDITRALYSTLLRQGLDSDRARQDAATIDRRGYAGIQEVAISVARDAESQQIFAGRPSREVMGELYRGLLRRTQTDEQLWEQDRGFRAGVDELNRRGLAGMVQTIVRSPEFREANDLARNGLLEVRYGDRN
ncbi:MAG TPA: hypothetical protein VOA87_22800 [Thermoanaerobaculia bacterium]|nr:hypothetical protein [Thermoanaerobaculia bacterium]